jgi:hypothetical protein
MLRQTNAGNTGCARSFGLSLGVTCVVSALLTVLKETRPGVLLEMVRLGGHHWITHGVFTLVLFLVLGTGLQQLNQGDGPACRDETVLLAVVGGPAAAMVILVALYARA